jgi:hypothetical protein
MCCPAGQRIAGIAAVVCECVVVFVRTALLRIWCLGGIGGDAVSPRARTASYVDNAPQNANLAVVCTQTPAKSQLNL